MTSPPVVLVVEDNAELRLVLKEALASEGYEVVVARDDAEALEILRASSVNLMISDLIDSGSGESTFEIVREEFPDLPVVAISADRRRHPTLFFAGWAGAPSYRTLSKPFRLGELLAVSREVLGPTTDASPGG